MITILATTYVPPDGLDRADAIEVSLRSWREHIKVSGGIHVHIADDGSAVDLESRWRDVVGDWASFSYSRQERKGVGASLNRGLAICREKSPLVLYPMDDWRLVSDVDLDPWVEILTQHQDVGCIRLAPSGGTGGGTARRFGAVVAVEFRRDGHYWSLLPALYHERFFQAYGAFAEGISAVDAETDYNQKVKSTNGPAILVAFLCPWQHAGPEPIGMGALRPKRRR
jgi:hypothetical protein